MNNWKKTLSWADIELKKGDRVRILSKSVGVEGGGNFGMTSKIRMVVHPNTSTYRSYIQTFMHYNEMLPPEGESVYVTTMDYIYLRRDLEKLDE